VKAPHDHSEASTSSKGCVLTPPCYRPSTAYPRQLDRKAADQRRCSGSGEEAPKTPSPIGRIRLDWHLKRVDQRLHCSEADLWAWLDLNQRPHPYQQNAGNRCANRHSRRSRSTVEGEVMCSHRVQLCALATRLELPGHAVVVTASFGASPPPFTTINASYSANGRSLGRVTDPMSMCGGWPRFPARSSGRMILTC
jgi:hypothetical protein